MYICGELNYVHNSTQNTYVLVSYFWKRIPLHLKHIPKEGSQSKFCLSNNYFSFVSKEVLRVNENALKVRSQKVAGLKGTCVTMREGSDLSEHLTHPFHCGNR